MASTTQFVEYVYDQLVEIGNIRYKKMFGEYGFYCDNVFYAMICEDRFLVKITGAGKAYMPNCETQCPYEGAKPYFYITDLENRSYLKELTLLTCKELRKKKK